MGGNARVIDRRTGKILANAEKIDLRVHSRSSIVKIVLSVLENLNTLYELRYVSPLWENFEDIKRLAFTGSTAHFMDPGISDNKFLKHKPVIGDIDIVIPEENKLRFEKLMHSLENRKIARNVTYLGQDRTDFGTTFLGVFRHWQIGNESLNFQIDFEYGKYTDGRPSDWARFSHSSAWTDILVGMKGVHHKFLLINLVRVLSKKNDILIATPSSTPLSLRLVSGKRASQTPRLLAFSVDKGLRVKYKQMRFGSVPVYLQGKTVYQEVTSKDSEYTRDIPEIYTLIFGKAPTPKEIELFGSYTGLSKLIAKKLSTELISELFDFVLTENLFGKHAQVIEKDNPTEDRRVKLSMVEKMFEDFPHLKTERFRVKEMIKEYYKQKKCLTSQ